MVELDDYWIWVYEKGSKNPEYTKDSIQRQGESLRLFNLKTNQTRPRMGWWDLIKQKPTPPYKGWRQMDGEKQIDLHRAHQKEYEMSGFYKAIRMDQLRSLN